MDFYEGPPTANGKPGLHHVWARVFKDLYPRFQTMRGKNVPRKGGWDCHGLPVELEVERSSGCSPSTTSRRSASPSSTSDAAIRCSATWRTGRRSPRVREHGSIPPTPTGRCRTTMSSPCGGCCVRCGTKICSTKATASRPIAPDVAPPCRRTSWPTRRVSRRGRPFGLRAFPVTERPGGGDPIDLLVWTTTPWTLISNVAAAVGADIEYVRSLAPTAPTIS